jgi:hypothetical protein
MPLPRCRYCNHLLNHDIPVLFKRTQQLIFEHIWLNPGQTELEIRHAVYGRTNSEVIRSHLSRMRKILRDTNYTLLSIHNPTNHGAKFTYRCYYIQPRQSAAPTKQYERPVQESRS